MIIQNGKGFLSSLSCDRNDYLLVAIGSGLFLAAKPSKTTYFLSFKHMVLPAKGRNLFHFNYIYLRGV